MKQPSDSKGLYYGWWIAGELAITETITWGIVYYSFTVFITSMEAELGWSRSTIAGASSLALLISGFMAFPVGYWIDRFGGRWLMTGGVTIASLLVYAWAHVQTVFGLYAIWALMGVMMAATLYEPAFAVIAHWFIRHRGRALAVITFAAGFASTIFLPLADWLLEQQGWRGAVQTLAIILAVGTIPLHALVLRRKPQDLGLNPDGATEEEYRVHQSKNPSTSLVDALKSRQFWWLTLGFSLAALGVIAIRYHFILLLLDREFSPRFAASAAGAIGAMQVAGRVIFAPLSERIPGRTVTAGLFFILAVSMILLRYIQGMPGVIVFVIVFGAAYGAITLARPSMLADYFGSEHYGKISSIMAIFFTIASTLAPLGASWLYDWWHSYDPILWVLAFIMVLSIIATMMIPPQKTNS